jgi:CBS domain-containing protein
VSVCSKAHQCHSLTTIKATIQDLDPPPALSLHPSDPIHHAKRCAFERDYTHLTVVSQENRSLLGYLSIPQLNKKLDEDEKKRKEGKEGPLTDNSPVGEAMMRFRRKGKVYKVITMDTPLEELEEFFNGGINGSEAQDFAVVTDFTRRFVLGVATQSDLEEFVKRRPG